MSWTGWRFSTRPIRGSYRRDLHHPGQLRKSWYFFFFFFALPELPESVVHADHWHFFRNFLREVQ